MKNQSLLFVTILILLNCRMNLCFGETYRVPIDYGTIRAAVDACVDGDRVLVSDGIYSGIGNTNIDFNGKGITVTSVSGSGACTIDCMGNGRAFYLHNNENNRAEIIGFTIINGDVTDGFDQHESGGAVYCSSGSPVIADCNFFDNTATQGGAIYINAVDGSVPVIRNCHFSRNHAVSGGAVYIEPVPEMAI